MHLNERGEYQKLQDDHRGLAPLSELATRATFMLMYAAYVTLVLQWLLLQLSAVLTCKRGLWVIFYCIDP